MPTDLEQAYAESGELISISGHQVQAIVPDFSEATGNALFGEDVAIEAIDVVILPGHCLTGGLLRATLTIRGETFVPLSIIRHQDGAITLSCRRRATR